MRAYLREYMCTGLGALRDQKVLDPTLGFWSSSRVFLTAEPWLPSRVFSLPQGMETADLIRYTV